MGVALLRRPFFRLFKCEDASQQFVGGGDDGALVAALAGQTLVMRLELALVGARGGVGALDEHGAQRAVAAPDAPGTAGRDWVGVGSRSLTPFCSTGSSPSTHCGNARSPHGSEHGQAHTFVQTRSPSTRRTWGTNGPH